MIISKTPLRISFAGGGTDFQEFYKNQPGAVVSVAINKYIYIFIHKYFDNNRFLLKYSKVEEGKDINKIKNNLIREAMKLTNVTGVEIVSMSDVPMKGVGLGSSSSFIVGLLNALYKYKGINKSQKEIAQEACQIEINLLKNPIGKQDQYIASYGGLRNIVFYENENVNAKNIRMNQKIKKQLDSNLLLFYIGRDRKSHEILSEQKENTKKKLESLIKMRNIAQEMANHLAKNNLDDFGEMLHRNWLEKKQLAKNISDSKIDYFYKKAIDNGALGGKICGAGGGGFLLFYCPLEKQEKLKKALNELVEFPFRFDLQGTKIIKNV